MAAKIVDSVKKHTLSAGSSCLQKGIMQASDMGEPGKACLQCIFSSWPGF